MNKMILEEKETYWDNQITLKDYIKMTKKAGYIDCSENWDYEFTFIIENLEKLVELLKKGD